MKITTISKENLKYFKGFISTEDARFIKEDLKILPIGLVADDIQEGKNMAAGAICVRPDDFMLNITSFYVSPEYRGRGAGKFLLDEVRRIFGEEDMEYNVEFLVYGKEQEKFALFLEEYGFDSADPEYDLYMSYVDDLKKTKLYGKNGDGAAFADIDHRLFGTSQKTAEKEGAILPLGGFNSENIDKNVSVGIVNNNKIESFVIYEKAADNTLLLSSVFSKKGPATLLHMLEKSVNLISSNYTDDTGILIQSVEETTDDLIDNIFDNARNISCRYRYVI